MYRKAMPPKEIADRSETAPKETDELKIEGRNPVMEALKSGKTIDKILVAEGEKHGSIIQIERMAKEQKILIQPVDRRRLDDMSETNSHQGVIAYLAAAPYYEISDMLDDAKEKGEDPFIIVADEINDPHNLGAILRTANCAGAHGVIIPKHRSVGLSSTVFKTAAGAALYTKVAKVTNVSRAIDELKEAGLWIAAVDMDGDEMYRSNLTGPIALVVGSEGSGISPLVKKHCDFIISIPLKGEITSLNASVAASVGMYEVVRQRKLAK